MSDLKIELRPRERVQVYRCSAHGVIEATSEYQEFDFDKDEPGPVQHMCPVNVGYDGACGMRLDGPLSVLLLEHGRSDVADDRERG